MSGSSSSTCQLSDMSDEKQQQALGVDVLGENAETPPTSSSSSQANTPTNSAAAKKRGLSEVIRQLHSCHKTADSSSPKDEDDSEESSSSSYDGDSVAAATSDDQHSNHSTSKKTTTSRSFMTPSSLDSAGLLAKVTDAASTGSSGNSAASLSSASEGHMISAADHLSAIINVAATKDLSPPPPLVGGGQKPTSQLAELRSLLERANLAQYLASFCEQGGDDVRQLCEADESEFKEICDLVGMSSKPLHVKRLRKALDEYKASQPTAATATATAPFSGYMQSLFSVKNDPAAYDEPKSADPKGVFKMLQTLMSQPGGGPFPTPSASSTSFSSSSSSSSSASNFSTSPTAAATDLPQSGVEPASQISSLLPFYQQLLQSSAAKPAPPAEAGELVKTGEDEEEEEEGESNNSESGQDEELELDEEYDEDEYEASSYGGYAEEEEDDGDSSKKKQVVAMATGAKATATTTTPSFKSNEPLNEKTIKKNKVIELYTNGERCVRRLSNLTGVPLTTVYRVIGKLKGINYNIPRGNGAGRKTILDAADRDILVNILNTQPRISRKALGKELEKLTGKSIHNSTLNRELCRLRHHGPSSVAASVLVRGSAASAAALAAARAAEEANKASKPVAPAPATAKTTASSKTDGKSQVSALREQAVKYCARLDDEDCSFNLDNIMPDYLAHVMEYLQLVSHMAPQASRHAKLSSFLPQMLKEWRACHSKSISPHEHTLQAMDEAAAQICLHKAPLLTRPAELLDHARKLLDECRKDEPTANKRTAKSQAADEKASKRARVDQQAEAQSTFMPFSHLKSAPVPPGAASPQLDGLSTLIHLAMLQQQQQQQQQMLSNGGLFGKLGYLPGAPPGLMFPSAAASSFSGKPSSAAYSRAKPSYGQDEDSSDDC